MVNTPADGRLQQVPLTSREKFGKDKNLNPN